MKNLIKKVKCRGALCLMTTLTSIFLAVLVVGVDSSYAVDATLRIDRTQQHAQIDGFGSWSDQFPLDRASDLPSDLDIEFLRFSVGTERTWQYPTIEPSNDNNDPFSINWSAFRFDTRWDAKLAIMRELYLNRGIKFTPSMWFYPTWMVDSDPDGSNKRFKPGMLDEAAEHIAAFLLRARQNYGLDERAIPLISVANEPCPGCDWAYGWRISGDTLRDLIKAVGQMFTRYGIRTKISAATTPHSAEMGGMLGPTLDDSMARSYLGAVDFHSYGMSPDRYQETLNHIRDIRAHMSRVGLDLPIYDTEMAGQCNAPLTWSKAWNMLIQFIYLLREDVSLLLPNIGNNNCGDRWGGPRGPQSYIFEHFYNHLPVGSHRIDANWIVSDANLVPVAYSAPTGNIVLHVVNKSSVNKPLVIEGLSGFSTAHKYKTDQSQQTFVDLGETSITSGYLNVTLTPYSLTTLVVRGSGGTNTPPSVQIQSPQNGDRVFGAITISANASDANGIDRVEFYIDNNTNYQCLDATYPYTCSWDTRSVPNGNHSIRAIAYDRGSPQMSATDSVSITVDNLGQQNLPPTVSITNPQEGQTVRGRVYVQASASDPDGIRDVKFYIDGAYRYTDSTVPYTYDWDTMPVPDGNHRIKAEATDNRGLPNYHEITVIVDNVFGQNLPPVVNIAYPTDGQTVSGTIDVTANAVDPDGTINRVEFYIDNSLKLTDRDYPYAYAWNTTNYTNTTHEIQVKAFDNGSPQLSSERRISVTVNNAGPIPQILFSDNFNDGNANGWLKDRGTWSVANGQYYSRNTENTSRRSWVSGRTFNQPSFNMLVRLKMEGGQGAMGLTAYDSASTRYSMFYNKGGSQLVLYDNVGLLASRNNLILNLNQWYMMKISFSSGGNGLSITGKIWPQGSSEANATTITATDTTPLPVGTVGLFCRDAATTCVYDDVVVSTNP